MPGGIGIFHGSFQLGGGERVLVEQVRALAPWDVPVDLWNTHVRRDGPVGDLARAANPRLRDVGLAHGRDGVAGRLRERRYDLVLTCSNLRVYRALLRARLLPWRRRRLPPLFETVHDTSSWSLETLRGRRPRAVDRWLLTYDFRDLASKALGVPTDRMSICRPLFADSLLHVDDRAREAARALRRSWGVGDGAVVLGYLGRSAGAKGLLEMVEITRRLASSGRDVHLVLAGRRSPEMVGWDERLEAAARAACADPRVGPRVHVVGPVASREETFAAFDVTVLLTRSEGLFPLMLVESMSAGVPIVATDVGGLRTCLDDGVHAALVTKRPDDGSPVSPEVVAEFERRVAELVDDASLRRRLAEAGRERVRSLVASNDFHGDFRRALAPYLPG